MPFRAIRASRTDTGVTTELVMLDDSDLDVGDVTVRVDVPIVARSAGGERLNPTRLADFSLTSRDGRQIPLNQIGHWEICLEKPILKRRDRTPIITIRSDINEATQPPEVSKQIMTALQPLIASLPAGYRIDTGGSIEERPTPRWVKFSQA